MFDVAGQPLLQEALEHGDMLVRYTVEQYHQFIASGLLPEDTRTELIDGLLVMKDRAKAGDSAMTIGDRHRVTVTKLARLAAQFDAYGCFLQTQQPISIPPNNEPEPDISVIRGSLDNFLDHPALGKDTVFVLEVSDSSLRRDLRVKLPIYADGGVAEFIVVNLVENVILIHRRPKEQQYLEVSELRSGDTLKLPTAGAQMIDVPVIALIG